MSNKTFCGIDYSYTSPAFTLYDSSTKLYKTHYLTKTKRCQGIFKSPKGNYELIGEPSYEGIINGSQRYYTIAKWVLEELQPYDIQTILIEGYSLGSKGSRVFDIAENAGMLKYALLDSGYDIVVKSPKEIKKWFCGNGSVGKYTVEKVFNLTTGFDIRDVILSKAENPVSDICDSFAMCEMARSVDKL